jgi:uncharacterized protein
MTLWDEIPGQRGALGEVAHRPWPVPERPWLMGQTWRELLFAHWALAPDAVRRVVPPALELDLRDGAAWVGVTPFKVTGLRPHGLPPVASFLEVNVRTYVAVDGKPGIYFFSLDASSRPAVVAARVGYRLPYFHARASADGGRFRSRRSSGGAELDVSYEPSGPELPVVDGSLERWLAERYCLYTLDREGRPLRGDIHHRPWPLRPARARIEHNTMAEPLGLDLTGEPLLHYSARQDTLLWALR